MTDRSLLMRLENVTKKFGGLIALRGVDLQITSGRVHGLLGANGAGKSTLIKIISGAYEATSGQIYWRGGAVSWSSPRDANDSGVATIHQHIPLVSTLSVLENVFLAAPGFWRQSLEMRERFDVICERVGYSLNPDALVGDLRIGARQMVAIFQALGSGADLIVMDEPTASLAIEERELVYRAVRRLTQGENKAILFVSHFLDEIIALTDEVTVLRDGQAVLRAETKDLDESKIAEAIVGRRLAAMETTSQGRSLEQLKVLPELLELRELGSPGKLQPISLKLRAGEVLGIAGLLGSGRSELLHAIFGADADATGDVVLRGKTLRRSTSAAVKAGIALVPEDRMRQGLVPGFEIWRNTTLPALKGVSAGGVIPIELKERERALDAIQRLSIKAQSPDVPVTELSGGNAQKVTIAKWLYSNVDVFLLDEPTAGIDVGAKADILMLVRKLASEGKAVIVVSSEFEELIAACDRILVMRDGRCIAERSVASTSEHELILLASGHTVAQTAA
ncbi:sugar ABC transporter ATP-binding protein [Rhizobium leguminosarum]|uniref:sugar ABC transporter ATP-binding protein n=1 Tax=Rhizobium leguminosarum TaxID=384 RepID=UPI003ECEAA54